MIGLAQGAFEAALAYVKERKQFGQAVSENQGIQFQLGTDGHRYRNGATACIQFGPIENDW